MTEKFSESVNKGNTFGALLSDLSKAFDCIDYMLLIAKIFAFTPYTTKGLLDLAIAIQRHVTDNVVIKIDLPNYKFRNFTFINV